MEREAIMSRVFRLQPGPRKAFMVACLEALNAPHTLQPPPAPRPVTKVTITNTKTRRRYTKKTAPRE